LVSCPQSHRRLLKQRDAAANRVENFQLTFRGLVEEVCADYPEIMFQGEGRSLLTIAGLSFDVAAKLAKAMAQIDRERFRSGLS
jgi:hypothetical protein